MPIAHISQPTLILRNIAKSDGSVTTAIPAIVISESDSLLATYIPQGTLFKNNWVIPEDQRVASVDNIVKSSQREYKDLIWRNPTVRLYLPGVGFSVWLNFDKSWGFNSWYCNLEAPFVRTPTGIDTRDYALDIVGTVERTWVWKDKEEFERRLEVGIDTAEHQAKVLSDADEFIRRFESNQFPFDMGWEDWRPKAGTGIDNGDLPRLPENWSIDYGSGKIFDSNG